MSTNNFKFENILIAVPDFSVIEDGDFIGFDTFAYDEWQGELQDELIKIGFEDCDKYDGDRNYGGRIISRYGLEDTDGMIVWLEVVVRDGYYGGQNVDYTIDGDFGIENEQNKKQVAHYEAMHRKLDKMKAKVEKILRNYGTELLKVGQFSNGEAVYELKNKKDDTKRN